MTKRLPASVRDRLRHGSRSSQIALVIHQEVLRCGYGPTVDEARQAFARSGYHVPPSFVSEVHSLRRRGILRAEGRPSKLRYALTGVDYPRLEAPLGDDDIVIEALRAATSRFGTLVSTRDVLDSIRALGRTLRSSSQNAVRSILLGLVRARVRGEAAWHGAVVRHVVVEGVDGLPRSFWGPADGPELEPPTEPVTSRREATVVLVGRAIERLQSMPSRTDLALEARALPDDSRLRTFFPGGTRPRVLTALKAYDLDAGRGLLRVYRSPLAAHGGVPTRYWIGALGAPDPVHEAIALVDDHAYAYRFVQEWEQIARVRRSTTSSERDLLESVFASRIAGLDRAGMLLENALSLPLPDALQAAATASDLRRTAYPAATRSRRTSPEGRRGSIAHALEAARSEGLDQRVVPLVGSTMVLPLQDLAPWTDAEEAGDRGAGPMLPRVRRFPNPEADGRARPASGAAMVATALVDRPEALVALGYRVGEPWTRQILLKAYQLLGETTRDASVLSSAMHRSVANPCSVRLRRLLLIVGGLTNLEGTVDLACSVAFGTGGTVDTSDAKTAVLATALSTPARLPEVLALFSSRDTAGTNRDLLRKLRARASRGRCLGVVPG